MTVLKTQVVVRQHLLELWGLLATRVSYHVFLSVCESWKIASLGFLGGILVPRLTLLVLWQAFSSYTRVKFDHNTTNRLVFARFIVSLKRLFFVVYCCLIVVHGLDCLNLFYGGDTTGSFQPNSTRFRNWFSQIFIKFLPFNCLYERNISLKF